MKYFRWLTTLAYAGFIFYLSSRPWSGLPSFKYADKIYHLILYMGLGGLLLWSLRSTKLRGYRYIGLWALITATLYGLSDEIHQIFVPGRQFCIYDLLADAIGAIMGVLIASILAMFLRKEKIKT